MQVAFVRRGTSPTFAAWRAGVIPTSPVGSGGRGTGL